MKEERKGADGKMGMQRYEEALFGDRAQVLNRQGERTIYQIDGDGGVGRIADYSLYPGISMQFNEIECEVMPAGGDVPPLLELNYCMDGQFECEFSAGGCIHLRAGEFAASTLSSRKRECRFPLGHYRGVSLMLDVDAAQDYMDAHCPELALRLRDLPQRLCLRQDGVMIDACAQVGAVFRQMYEVPPCAALAYYRVKVLELLVILSGMPACAERCAAYFSCDRKAVMQRIRDRLRQNVGEEVTLPELARENGLCLTVLKRDFAAIYGVSPGAYHRRCRMQAAAKLLVETRDRVTDIAAQVGYQNVSKFAAAFREEMGEAPMEYRKKRGFLERRE